jgi:hypothetical protein
VAQYNIEEHRLCSSFIGDRPAVVVHLIISRNIISSIMTDFLPVLMSMCIGHLTNYFNQFEVSIGTNLTILLVLVTL